MRSSLFKMLDAINGRSSIAEWIDSAPRSELVEIDLAADRYRTTNNIKDKFVSAPEEGAFTELYQTTLDELIHPDDYDEYRRFMDPATLAERINDPETNGVLAHNLRFKVGVGNWRWVELCLVGGEPQGFDRNIVKFYTFDTATMSNNLGEGALEAPSPSVDLCERKTGLLWERPFFDQAQALLAEIDTMQWSVIAIDLDHFSLFNDWYGRETGDLLIAQVGKELQLATHAAGGLAGYLGRDDFCLVAPHNEERLNYLYDRLSAIVDEHATASGFKPVFGVSIADKRISFLDLYDQARMALDYARGDFKTDIVLYEPAMRERDEREYRVLLDFQRGLREQEFVVYLQPQCRISTRKIVGAEALARWVRPDGSIVPPNDFVPILEKHGFVTDLDCYIWERVCAKMHAWIESGHAATPVSMNVSQNDFYAIDVPAHFAHLVEKHQIDPSLVKIEITESAFGEEASLIEEDIKRLREMGFLVLMDDFGSGYSSLNRLSSLNVDAIKLDAEFLNLEDETRRKGVRIVESVVSMAKTMALPIICEGVETKEQIDFLDSLGCRYIQGFYYYRPMTTDDFEALVSDAGMLDEAGFAVKTNDQLQIREFLDQNVYSDAMLNTILGPVAFYLWHDEAVDIIRFNEQFYEAIGPASDLDDRLHDAQRFVPDDERARFFDLFKRATQDQLNGATDVVGFFRADGTLARFVMRVYYLGESEEGKRFYGSVRDITEIVDRDTQLKLLSEHLPMTIVFMRRIQGRWRMRVIVHGLSEEMGIGWEQFERELNEGSFRNRIVKADAKLVEKSLQDSLDSGKGFSVPFGLEAGQGNAGGFWLVADRVQDKAGLASFVMKVTADKD